jgi:hypothetical protein
MASFVALVMGVHKELSLCQHGWLLAANSKTSQCLAFWPSLHGTIQSAVRWASRPEWVTVGSTRRKLKGCF